MINPIYQKLCRGRFIFSCSFSKIKGIYLGASFERVRKRIMYEKRKINKILIVDDRNSR